MAAWTSPPVASNARMFACFSKNPISSSWPSCDWKRVSGGSEGWLGVVTSSAVLDEGEEGDC